MPPPFPPNPPVIVREEPQWLVLCKPPGWHTVAPGKRAAAKRGDEPGPPDIETWLRSTFPWARHLPEGGLVHRLDFDTSGCLLIARDVASQERLRAAMRRDAIEKDYLALVRPGLIESGEFTLYFSSRRTRSPKVTVRERGEPRELGRCAWRTLERTAGWQLLEVRLIGAGRRHQIRAGMARLGHPLLGDALYGGAPWEGGLSLHAARLTVDGVVVTCPPPPAWPKVTQSPRSTEARGLSTVASSFHRRGTPHDR